MVGRCHNPNRKDYIRYGGRGICVHPSWRVKGKGCPGFNSFLGYILSELGPKPDGKTLDRVNNDGNYEPGNLKWSTLGEQAANQRQRRGGFTKPNHQKKLPWCTKTRNGKYQAQFMFDKVMYRAGTFETEEAAHEASARLRSAIAAKYDIW